MSDSWQSKADRPELDDGLQYHIQCRRGDVNKYVLLPGDPARVDEIAATWDESRRIANHREHRTASGVIFRDSSKSHDNRVAITACSTGMGGPSTSIALEELAALGADTFIRVGTCGAIQPEIQCGDLIVCSGAMRQDGTSPEYIDLSYPAVASYEIVAALVAACEKLNLRYHVGVSCTTASFHLGQARPGLNGYTQSNVANKIEDLRRARVLDFEMESATVFTMAGVYGLRAGAIFTVVANRVSDQFVYSGNDRSVAAANEAVRILAAWDASKIAKNKRYWFPGI